MLSRKHTPCIAAHFIQPSYRSDVYSPVTLSVPDLVTVVFSSLCTCYILESGSELDGTGCKGPTMSLLPENTMVPWTPVFPEKVQLVKTPKTTARAWKSNEWGQPEGRGDFVWSSKGHVTSGLPVNGRSRKNDPPEDVNTTHSFWRVWVEKCAQVSVMNNLIESKAPVSGFQRCRRSGDH